MAGPTGLALRFSVQPCSKQASVRGFTSRTADLEFALLARSPIQFSSDWHEKSHQKVNLFRGGPDRI